MAGCGGAVAVLPGQVSAQVRRAPAHPNLHRNLERQSCRQCWPAEEASCAFWLPVAGIFDRHIMAHFSLPADSARVSAIDIGYLAAHLCFWHGVVTFYLGSGRLAPLSEGRIEPSDGTLQCSYHGEALHKALPPHLPATLWAVE